jgi:FKBP-type peptidyl-prolyl cis-trans isomerase FklB
MKLKIAVAAAALTMTNAFAADSPALKDQKDKVSYSIGLDIGRNMKQQSLDINPDILAAGLKDALTDAKPKLTDEEMKQTMMAFQQEMQQKQMLKMKGAGDKNKKEGEAFLAANAKKDGVKTKDVTLPDGKKAQLQYKVVSSGKGKTPKPTDTVTTHYRGTLINGKEFDSSYKRGEPVSFPVSGVIKGWTEALQLMKEGDKWQLFIPSELAYGERGAGNDIESNSTLIFDIELIKVQ